MSEGRLPRSGGTDECHRPPRLHAERDRLDPPPILILNDFLPHGVLGEVIRLRFVVQIPDRLDPRCGPAPGSGRPDAVLNGFLLLEHALDPVHSHDRAGHLTEQPAEYPHRHRHQPEQIGERDHGSRCHGPLLHPPSSHGQHRQNADTREGLHQRIKHRPQRPHLNHAVAQRVRSITEASNLLVLPAESLDHQRGIKGLMGNLGNLSA